jgi:LytS/YehU family sensor histidine kinase
LEEEIIFIKNYIFLLETRFENKFNVTINIADDQFWIPPVTLQQLVENAIKHNETSYSKPLEIIIRQEGEYLMIMNDRQPKKTTIESTGIGLANIIQRFELLTDLAVSYAEKDNVFIVKIPLISNYESGNH